MAFPLHAFLALSLVLALHSSHARELHAFNKIPAGDTAAAATATATGVEAKESTENVEPTFLPETNNAYGLYDQNPSRAEQFTGEFNPRLPKNYNPVAYVTQPEDFTEPSGSGKENFFGVDERKEIDENPSKYGYNEEGHGTNYNYNERRRYDFNSNGGAGKSASLEAGSVVRGGDSMPQGMSDTRALENGKYYYDLNAERFNSNHPYEVMKQGFNENKYIPSNYGQSSFSGAARGYSNFWP